ncbi:GNAT family N-acetyltransferase [Acinetobacter sp. FL51]|uniref:GNAT family N-acetyltransferase n=1 Tax=Acinetobacter sp. FL51 TaxID=2777978 RepID=UPI0018E16B92|nr:GNAT family N-acetyltransferase [Acinetobacter sp. FL51]MBI1450387.1 GNAT family N-acetyltransferase [Acinetobacter sp. FL51]
MRVRVATVNDIETLVDFGKRLTLESPKFSKHGFDVANASEFFLQVIEKLSSIFLVLDEYDNPIGGVICLISKEWSTGQKVAYEQALYVLPEYRSTGAGRYLVQAFREWAEQAGADRIQIGTMTGIHVDKTVQLYESLGFELAGYTLEREV